MVIISAVFAGWGIREATVWDNPKTDQTTTLPFGVRHPELDGLPGPKKLFII